MLKTKPTYEELLEGSPEKPTYEDIITFRTTKPTYEQIVGGDGPIKLGSDDRFKREAQEAAAPRIYKDEIGKKKTTLADVGQALKETPENLWIGTVGMSASVMEAVKREGMRYSGGGILPDEAVRHQFEAVKPSQGTPFKQPLPGAVTAEAFGLTTRLPDIAAKIIRDYQQGLVKEQDEVTLSTAPITKLARSVTQSGVPSMAVALGVSLLTKNPIVGLGILGTIEGGAAFEQQLQTGGSVRKSLIIGDLSAAAEIGGEMLVFPKFVKGLKEGIPLAQALTLIVENAGQEGATGFTQRFLEVFGTKTSEGMGAKEAAKLAFDEGVNAIPENAWVGGATAGLVDLVSTGTGRLLKGPQLKESLVKNGVSPKVAQRATEMLEEGWKPGEIDRLLITPSKFIGDKAIEQAEEEPTTWEDVKVKRDLAEIDEQAESHLRAIREEAVPTETTETPATRGRQAPDIAPEQLSVPEGVKLPPGAEIEAVGVAAEAKEQTFTMFAAEHGYTDDYSLIDHSELSPSGKRSKRGETARLRRMDERFKSNREGHKAFNKAILADEIIDPSGKVTKEGLLVRQKEAEAKKVSGRISQIDAQIRFTKDTGQGKRGLKPTARKRIAELEAEREQLLTKPPTEAKKKTLETLREKIQQEEEDVSDEELGGITKSERRRLIKENAAKIESSDIYQNEIAGLETSAREVGPGYYYIDKGYRGEVEAIIGKRKGFPTRIQRMFTFDPTETRIINTPSGKAEVGPSPWEGAVQEGLGRGKEGVEQTWGEMDISEFVQRVVDSYQQQETIGGINKQALQKAEESGRPDEQLWAEKHRMLAAGYSDQAINEMVTEWADEWGIETEDIEGEFVSEYGTKLRQIKRMEDPDTALEQLATEQIEAEDRRNAVIEAQEVLEANDIQAEVEEVEEIRPLDLLGRPVLEGGAAGKQRGLGELGLEFTQPEVKDPEQMEFGQLPEEDAKLIEQASRSPYTYYSDGKQYSRKKPSYRQLQGDWYHVGKAWSPKQAKQLDEYHKRVSPPEKPVDDIPFERRGKPVAEEPRTYKTKTGKIVENPIRLFGDGNDLTLAELHKMSPNEVISVKRYSAKRGGVARGKIKVGNLILPELAKPVGAAITQGQKQVILLAYGADSETGYHEGYHILRRQLTEKNTKVLDRHFKGDEEAEATAFAEYVKTGKTKTFLRGIWQKLRKVLRKVKSGLAGRGFRTAEDIFGAIQRGTVEKAPAKKLIEPTIAFEKREFKSLNEFKNKGEFLQYVKPQLRERPHPWVPGSKTVRPYVVGYGCDGSTDMNIHYVAQKMARALGIDYADAYVTAYPERSESEQSKAWIEMLKGDLRTAVDEAYKTKKVEETTVIPRNATIQNVLNDLYDINNRSLENELEERIEKKGISLDTKLKDLNLAPAASERVQFETSGEKARREVEKKARIKARKARLASEAGVPKRRRGRQAPRIRIKLQDHTPPLRADLAPLPREAAEERPLKTKTLTRPVYTEKWFEENLKKEKRSILDKAGSETRRAWMGLEKVFSSSSTRLNNIAPKLFRATRQYIYNVLTRSTVMTEDVSGFVKATRKMSKEDYRQLDLALKNGIDWKTEQIVAKYGLTEQYQMVRSVLDDIYDAAKEVGIDIDYRKDYWPRVLKDPEGFLMYFQGREDWSIIEEAIKRRAKQAGRKIEDLTVDEKAHVVNTLLRGYRTQALTLSRPGPAKERTVESIDKKLDAFYDDSRTALHKYIRLMNSKIAEREFFGRETKEIQNLRKTQSARLTRLLKLKRRVGLKYPSEPTYKEHISKTAQNWKEGQERLDRLKARPLSETIGGYVMRLQAEGEISPTQEKEIQNILTGIFDPQRMGSRMGVFATGVYVDTLNSPLQALTQLDEFAYSFYRSPLRSIPVAIRTAARKSKITPRDIGITSIGEEFQGPSMKRALSLLLKSTGFEMVDRLNKENYINTVLSKYQAQAKQKNLNATFVNRIRKVFGDDYKGVIEDLRNNRISDNVKYLLFNEILDIQPIAITEMPEAYNKAGNMRILYSLKTFYMKRLDFIRNECFKDMKSKKTFARGFGKLVWLAGSFALMGAGSDLLKDFIKGRTFDLEDSIVDNLLRMAFFSKYQAWRTREKGLGTAVLEGWRPPTKAIDAVTKDIINEAQGKERGWELWRSVPLAGELYYWWFGEGRRRIEEKQGQESTWVD